VKNSKENAMMFTAGKLPNGKIVEVLGITPDKGISICHEIYSDKALELRVYVPLDTRFIWVREFRFNGV
jgi:hypothetical protein